MENNEQNPGVQPEQKPNEIPEPSEGEGTDWKAEAAKWRRLAEKNKKPQELPTEKSPSRNLDDSFIENFSLIKDYSQDELVNIRKEANELGTDLFKFVQSNSGKVFIDKMKSEKRAEDSTQAPSNRTFVYKGKTYQDVLKDPNSTADDKQAAFEAKLRMRRGVQSE